MRVKIADRRTIGGVTMDWKCVFWVAFGRGRRMRVCRAMIRRRATRAHRWRRRQVADRLPKADATMGGHVRADAGFTLIELLIVLGILALLASLTAPQVLRYLGRARTEAAKVQINAIASAIEVYALDNRVYPPPQIGLSALLRQPPGEPRWNGPYLKKPE